MSTENTENIENIEEPIDGIIGDCGVEIIDNVQVVDYSKGKSLHIRFNYCGEPTEEHPEGKFGEGGHIKFKFKDPRDTLKFLIKNLELLGNVEVGKLFDYVQHHSDGGTYSQLEIYYLLILEMKLPYLYFFKQQHPLPNKDHSEYTEEEQAEYIRLSKLFHDEYEYVIRLAHKFAVANTWKVWNDIQYDVRRNKIDSSEVIFTEEDIKRSSISKDEIFDTEYKGKILDFAAGFNLHRRLWQVFFKDGSWIIASDQGNGWYGAETNFDSYKLLGRS